MRGAAVPLDDGGEGYLEDMGNDVDRYPSLRWWTGERIEVSGMVVVKVKSKTCYLSLLLLRGLRCVGC